jgi:hypothetical protein
MTMKNFNVQFKEGRLVDIATGKELLLLEGGMYALLGDDTGFLPSDSKAVAEQRLKHPKAYMSWNKEEDEQLEELFCEQISLRSLCKIFGRNQGAIESRIEKLGLREKYHHLTK